MGGKRTNHSGGKTTLLQELLDINLKKTGGDGRSAEKELDRSGVRKRGAGKKLGYSPG